jgi:hypothetical protein
MFDVVADATGLSDKKLNQLKVHLQTSPSFLRTTTIEPEKVDYILRK